MDAIIKLVLEPFWGFGGLLIGSIPKVAVETVVLNATVLKVLSLGIYVTGSGQFFKILSVFLAFSTAQFVWAIIEWIYRKIPGVS